jgi:hypothetical protein
MSERRSRPALEALLVFEDVLSTLPGGRDGKVWVLAADGGRFVVEPSSVECERGLRARGGLCDADQLGSQRGLLGCCWDVRAARELSRASNRRVCYRAVNCLLSSVSVGLQQSLADGARLCRVSQGIAVCRGSVKNKRVAVASDVVVYEVSTDRGRWRIRRSSSTRTSRRRQKSGIPLCSSSGGARVMTRLFTRRQTS